MTTRDSRFAPEARAAILTWYATAGRDLSFRQTSDPYAVLVSEVLAQQTQAARAAEAWTGWMVRWPTVEALADATVADVLRAWAGLGYNRRALNLHQAARTIVAEHGGVVPSGVEDLDALPGVGTYTARAVAAIAFRVPAGAVDTNVRRVLGRVAAGGPEAFTAGEMQALADAIVPRERPDAWTHALMDLGAGPCRPANPRCVECPVIAWCRYAAGERPASSAAAGAAHTHRVQVTRRPGPAFPTTRRWLRGRILACARDAEDGAWVAYPEGIGEHPAYAVREAVMALAAEGLLEARERDSGLEARLPS